MPSGQVGSGPGAVSITIAPASGTVTSVSGGNTGLTFINPTTTPTLAGILAAANGGTGLAAPAAHGVLVGQGTGPCTVVLPGPAGQVLTSNGASADPSYQSLSALPIGSAGGDLTGNYPAPTLKATGTAGTVGDGTHWPIVTTDAQGRVTGMTAQLTPSALAILRGYIDGLVISRASTTNLTVAAGTADDSAHGSMLMLLSSMSKTISSTWTSGNNGGGLDTGLSAASTWYHIYLISQAGGASADVIFSTTAPSSGPSLPATYTLWRYIGSAKTDSLKGWIKFTQVGDVFTWFDAQNEANNAAVTNAWTSLTLGFTPPSVSVTAMVYLAGAASGGTLDVGVISGYADNTQTLGGGAVQFTYCLKGPAAATFGYASILVQTDTTPKLYVGAGAAGNYYLNILGYINQRGRNS